MSSFRAGSLEYIRRQLSADGKVEGCLVCRVLSMMDSGVVVEVLASDYQCGSRSGIPFRLIREHREIQVGELPVYISFPFKRSVYDRMLKGVV